MLHELKRLVREDDGMEFLEWSILGVIFAFAAAHLWARKGTIHADLDDFANHVIPNRYLP